MNLPIPTTLRGWSTAILILILLFVVYYGCFFKDLHSFYSGKQFYVQKEAGALRIDVPRYVASSGQRWVYVEFRNQQSFPLRDVSVWLDVQRGDKKPDRQNMPFLFGTSVAKPDVLIFEQIPPSGTVHGRLPLFVANPTTSTITVTVWVSSTVLPEPISASVGSEVEVNPWRFLAHSFIEQILLPPWSNGLLVLLVFVVCTLVEKNFSGTEVGGSREWWRKWWNVFYPSFMLVFLLTGVAFILPCFPWMFSWGELASWIAVLVFWIFMGWWVLDSLNLGSGALLEKWRSRMINLPFARRGKIGSFIPRIIPLVPLVVGLVLLVLLVVGQRMLRSHLPELLRPLVPILTVAMAVELLATVIKMRSTLVIPKPSGGRKWRKRRGTGGSRQPREYFRRSMPPRRKSG